MFHVPQGGATVTVLDSGANPRSTCSGSQGLASSFSAQQNEYLPGQPCVARSISPGSAPPIFCNISLKARPSVAFAQLPWPRQLLPLLTPSWRAIGPLMTSSTAAGLVVACTPWRLNLGSATASAAAISTGRYSG